MYRKVVEAQSDYKKSYLGNLETSLVVIRLGVIGLQKTSFLYLLDLFGRRGEGDGVI